MLDALACQNTSQYTDTAQYAGSALCISGAVSGVLKETQQLATVVANKRPLMGGGVNGD